MGKIEKRGIATRGYPLGWGVIFQKCVQKMILPKPLFSKVPLIENRMPDTSLPLFPYYKRNKGTEYKKGQKALKLL